ncbi:MAG: hypothetical protein WBQ17_11295 [Rhizomicrobium sp.]
MDGAQPVARRLIGSLSGGREILFEFFAQGAVVKVTAIDPATGDEVSIVGPARAPRATLQAAALQKLRYVQQKRGGKT